MAIKKNESIPSKFVYQHVFLCEQPFCGNLEVSLEVKLQKKVLLTDIFWRDVQVESPKKYKKKK